MKKIILSSILVTFCMMSCNVTPEPEPNNDDPQQDTTIVNSDTLVVDASYKKVSMHKQITHVQPMTGLVLWNDLAQSQADSYGDCISLEFSYMLPSDIVKGKNADGTIDYDWSAVDNKLKSVEGRGHQAVMRFRYEYPGQKTNGVRGGTAVPQYIKDMEDYNETYNSNAGGDGNTYYADWSNKELQWFTKQMYVDFAERYGNDPRLAFLEVGFGHWSEYHIYGTRLQLGVNFPSYEYQSEFLQHMANVMPIPWMISIDAADDSYTPICGSSELMALNFGLFDDSFMHSGHEIGSSDGYNERNWNAIGKGVRWQIAPCGGEISYYTSGDQRNFLNPQGMYGVTWEQASSKYHITFMISNDALGGQYASPERVKEGSMACGYRFEVLDCRTNGKQTKLLVTNKGIAPIYRDAYFTIGSTMSKHTLRGLLPGQNKEITIEAGLTDVEELAIKSDYIIKGQDIEFIADL